MKLKKLCWGVRAVLYSVFTKIGLPSYIGKPVYIKNLKGLNLGKKVRIYPGLRTETIGTGIIKIGNDVSVGQNAHISVANEELLIGNGVSILPNVCITNIDHDYVQVDEPVHRQGITVQHTEIGDNCCIGFGSVILAGTVLGKQCIIGANSVVRGVYPDYSVIVGSPAKVIKKYNPETGLWEKVK